MSSKKVEIAAETACGVGQMNYDEVLCKFPWINERGRYCVLSPDSDGLLCGLFMAAIRDWKIVGFYDDKVAVINKQYIPHIADHTDQSQQLVFLDGEIFRENCLSMGHHMVCYHKKKQDLLENSGFKNCIQPNLFRKFDAHSNFQRKYPLATIHMLVSIIGYAEQQKGRKLVLPASSSSPLLFTDGVYSILFSYTENIINWFEYLQINKKWNPLYPIFYESNKSFLDTMREMDSFFRERDKITYEKERGDRLKLSSSDGEPYNMEGIENDDVTINACAVERIQKFCTMIGNLTGWKYNDSHWVCWNNLQYYKFAKESFRNNGWRINLANFEQMLQQNPLSWAQGSAMDLEYTLETPSRFEFLI